MDVAALRDALAQVGAKQTLADFLSCGFTSLRKFADKSPQIIAHVPDTPLRIEQATSLVDLAKAHITQSIQKTSIAKL